eukprot:2911038-Pleurochrysis_carterae.AAC.1
MGAMGPRRTSQSSQTLYAIAAARIPHRTRCSGSGRELIRLFIAESDAASSAVAAAIAEAKMRALEISGMMEPTLRAFNDVHQEFDRLEHSLPANCRLADSLAADKLA